MNVQLTNDFQGMPPVHKMSFCNQVLWLLENSSCGLGTF